MRRVRYARIFWIGAAGILVLAALIGISALLRSATRSADGLTVALRPGERLLLRRRGL